MGDRFIKVELNDLILAKWRTKSKIIADKSQVRSKKMTFIWKKDKFFDLNDKNMFT